MTPRNDPADPRRGNPPRGQRRHGPQNQKRDEKRFGRGAHQPQKSDPQREGFTDQDVKIWIRAAGGGLHFQPVTFRHHAEDLIRCPEIPGSKTPDHLPRVIDNPGIGEEHRRIPVGGIEAQFAIMGGWQIAAKQHGSRPGTNGHEARILLVEAPAHVVEQLHDAVLVRGHLDLEEKTIPEERR